jgi:hypothetical protein
MPLGLLRQRFMRLLDEQVLLQAGGEHGDRVALLFE